MITRFSTLNYKLMFYPVSWFLLTEDIKLQINGWTSRKKERLKIIKSDQIYAAFEYNE